MRHLFLLPSLVLVLALLDPAASGQPAWGPVYHWGQTDGAVDAPSGYFKQVSTGWGYTIGLRPNGSIEVWGNAAPGLGGDWAHVMNIDLPAAGENVPSPVERGWDILTDRTDVENLTFPSDPVKIEGADYGYPSTVPAGTFLDFSSKQLHGAAISTCYADCDADGSVNAVLDYLCFAALEQANDISADCNGDNAVNSFDLVCFSSLLTSGCP